jgi:hypothetical protein
LEQVAVPGHKLHDVVRAGVGAEGGQGVVGLPGRGVGTLQPERIQHFLQEIELGRELRRVGRAVRLIAGIRLGP